MRISVEVRLTESVTLVTTTVVRDTLSDCHFSAWSRPKPAPDPLPGPSVASGVIPTKGGRNGPVPATSGRAPQGRWRSSPWKRCNHAPPRSGGQGAPRTARCIKTPLEQTGLVEELAVREHPAPLGALRLEHPVDGDDAQPVREHPAPLGALRHEVPIVHPPNMCVREHPAPLGALRRFGCTDLVVDRRVREHPAPLGVLRLPPRLGLHLCGQQVGERPAPLWHRFIPFALRVIRAWTGRD